MATQVDEQVVAEAKALAKLPYLAEFDADAMTAAVRDAVKEAGSPLGDETLLQQVFIKAGWDKSETPGGGEEGEEGGEGEEGEGDKDEDAEGDEDGEGKDDEDAEDVAAAAPAPEPVLTNNAMDVWRVLVGEDASTSADVRDVVSRLAVRVRGYGEAQLRFALGVMDADGASGVDEHGLWTSLRVCAPAPIEGVALTHMRRLWRAAETWLPAMPEEDGDEVDAAAMAEAKAALEAAKTAPRRVVGESWLGLLGEDEYAAALLLPEVEVPKEDKPEGEEGEEDDE